MAEIAEPTPSYDQAEQADHYINPSRTLTDHDMRNQVAETLGSEGADFDIEGIVSEIQATYGTVHIDKVPHDAYWGIVERHDNTLTEAALTDQGRADG